MCGDRNHQLLITLRKSKMRDTLIQSYIKNKSVRRENVYAKGCMKRYTIAVAILVDVCRGKT